VKLKKGIVIGHKGAALKVGMDARVENSLGNKFILNWW
jgi:GTPase Era involved in 16S rRNA processing